MSMHDVAEAIRHLGLFTAVRESRLFYPCVLATHLSCIAIFGGLILLTNLRLFGLALTRYSIAEVVRELRPLKCAGLITMVTAGILMAGSKFNIYYDNPYFQIKICVLFLIWIHSLVFRKSVYQDDTVPANRTTTTGRAKLAAALSLTLWITMVAMGRWIAYYDRTDIHVLGMNKPVHQQERVEEIKQHSASITVSGLER